MNEFLTFTFELFVITALIAANGFFVATEFALVKVRAGQLRPLAKTGGWRVKFALKATENLGKALSATQLGITLTSLGLGWIGEPFVAHRLEPLLGHMGIANAATVNSISFALAFGLITSFHIVLGELGPKWLAIQRPMTVTLNASAPLLVFYWVFFRSSGCSMSRRTNCSTGPDSSPPERATTISAPRNSNMSSAMRATRIPATP